METNTSWKPLKWAAKLDHVREVSLWGTADLPFWRQHLAIQKLNPQAFDGAARIMIVAAESKYLGVPFSEISFSVLVESLDNRFIEAAFLLQAFNSCRFFAFCERVFFSTPYQHAGVTVTCTPRPSMQLTLEDNVAFDAQLSPKQTICEEDYQSDVEHSWQGLVYLPMTTRTIHGREIRNRRGFVAHIGGDTLTRPFSSARDLMRISRDAQCSVVQLLRNSNFIPLRWEVRHDAAHAKSKTMTPNELSLHQCEARKAERTRSCSSD